MTEMMTRRRDRSDDGSLVQIQIGDREAYGNRGL